MHLLPPPSSAMLKVERTGSSETLVTTYKAAGSNAEDHSLNHCCYEENRVLALVK